MTERGDIGVRRICRSYVLLISLFWAGVISFDGALAVYLVEVLGWPASDVFLPAAIVHVGIALFEIPTGAFGDLYGRLRSARVGFVLIALSFGMLLFAHLSEFASLVLPIVFGLLFALGWTFFSGSVSAWVVDRLKQLGEESRLPRVFAAQGMVTNITLLGATALYSSFLEFSPMYCWAVSGLFVLFALLVSLRMSDTQPIQEGILSLKKVFQKSLEGVGYAMKGRALRYLLWAQASAYAINALFVHGILLESRGYKLGLLTAIGFWPILIGASVLGSFISSKLEVTEKGYRYFVGLSGVAGTLLILSIGLLSDASLPLILALAITVRIVNAVSAPFGGSELHRLIADSKVRNTVSSVSSLLMEASAGGLGLVLTLFLPKDSALSELWTLGAGLMLISFAIGYGLYLSSLKSHHTASP